MVEGTPQQDIDQVTALKAGLELALEETRELSSHFSQVLERLKALEALEPEARREGFQAMQEEGVFNFNGVDIRYFTQSKKRPLPPALFIKRTRRRFKNTTRLVQIFQERDLLENAESLLEMLDILGSAIVHENDLEAVQSFRTSVEEFRQSTDFTHYLDVRHQFMLEDAEIQTEANILASQEAVENGQDLLTEREETLEALGAELDSGEKSPGEVEAALEGLELA